ncbi:MAG: VWA domain-containing protein [Planctomycetes bacterium]|nr:VWA domain-containing protein [Planctomycetota bacterium]MCW8135502.1 VWA domain-containing protein [Planctomycetota bacterium]
MPEFFIDHAWLLAAALPLAALAVYAVLRTTSPLPRLRQALGGAALALALAALVVAAAGVSWHSPAERRTIWVLLDRSLSAGTAADRQLAGILEELRHSASPGDYIGVIGFGDRAGILLPPTAAAVLDPAMALPEPAPGDETWLAGALDLAVRATPQGTAPVALVVGDGHDSADRYAGDAASEARARNLPVFAIAVDSDPVPEVALADFHARIAGRERRVLALELAIQSTVAQRVVPSVRVNGKDMRADLRGEQLDAQGAVRVGAGRNPVRLELELAEFARTYIVEVSLGAEQDTYPGNGSARIAVAGEGDARLLLIHGDSGRERALERALGRAGVNVSSGPASSMPAELLELQRYQALVLCDVPATALSTAQHRIIERFTREGGGLAMVGGPASFAPGGWFETPVERVLPVTCDVTEKGRRNTPAMVIAFDRSGSMSAEVGGFTKMELANEGAVRTINLVPPNTMFGLLSVDTQIEWIMPVTRLSDRKLAAARARSQTVGGGGIYVDICMDEAFAALRDIEATSRHIVLFSDGADTERQAGVIEKTREANEKDGITVTVICMGNGKDVPFLRNLADAGKGRFFLVTDASDLPAVFSREAALSTANFIREEPFRPVHGLRGPLVEDVDFEAESSPPLLGYVAVTAREQAGVWLWADTDKERPLLATWYIELGRALAFASDARDRWADRWLPWERFDELWQRWVRWLLPEPERVQGVESEWVMTRQGPQLQLSFFDEGGLPRSLDTPSAELTLPDGTSLTVPVLPVGTGDYRVQLPRAGSGAYGVLVREAAPDGRQRAAAREQRMFVPVEELYRRKANTDGLRAVADATGGRLVTSAREAAAAPVTGGYDIVRTRNWMLALALAGLLFAIGARRFPSVWRRAAPDKPLKAPEPSAVAAYENIRKRRQQRDQPAPAPSGAWARAQAAPAQPRPASEPEPAQAGSLLSAMRKVRKELEERGRQ